MSAGVPTFLPWQLDVARAWLGRRERFAHAWLIHGLAGIGKARFAAAAAASLLCEAPREGLACGQCPACTWVASGNHPDLRRVRPDAVALEEDGDLAAPDDVAGEASAAGTAKKAPSREIRIDQLRALEPWFNTATHHPARVGRDKSQALREAGKVVNERTTNWTIGPCPTPGWARLVHPDLAPEAALAKLWEEIVHVCRLDEDDPVAAWRARMATLVAVAGRLTEARFDALHFEGPGTDLTVGLLPSSRWVSAAFETVDGIPHAPNLPSEEVFTTPDPERVEGVVRATKPLLVGGATIRGLTVRFEGGRAVGIDAEQGAETLRELTRHDDGGARLGEVALVDREGRIGPLGTVFYDTLLDENAASHIALGRGFDFAVGEEDVARVNDSLIHIDFMIGGDDVDVTVQDGDVRVEENGGGGAWQI